MTSSQGVQKEREEAETPFSPLFLSSFLTSRHTSSFRFSHSLLAVTISLLLLVLSSSSSSPLGGSCEQQALFRAPFRGGTIALQSFPPRLPSFSHSLLQLLPLPVPSEFRSNTESICNQKSDEKGQRRTLSFFFFFFNHNNLHDPRRWKTLLREVEKRCQIKPDAMTDARSSSSCSASITVTTSSLSTSSSSSSSNTSNNNNISSSSSRGRCPLINVSYVTPANSITTHSAVNKICVNRLLPILDLSFLLPHFNPCGSVGSNRRNHSSNGWSSFSSRHTPLLLFLKQTQPTASFHQLLPKPSSYVKQRLKTSSLSAFSHNIEATTVRESDCITYYPTSVSLNSHYYHHLQPSVLPSRLPSSLITSSAPFRSSAYSLALLAGSSQKLSPFSSLTNASTSNNITTTTTTTTNTESQTPLELNVPNVDKILDEVRPYLEADGGNCRVVKVAHNKVYLQLQGACGTCPSSVVTVKMGIERRLKERFPSLITVETVSPGNSNATELNAEGIEKVLDTIRPFLKVTGGGIRLVRLSVPPEGVHARVVLEFTGTVSDGLSMAIRNEVVQRVKRTFPILTDVQINSA